MNLQWPQNNKSRVQKEIENITKDWKTNRWSGIERPYTAKDVVALRGSLKIDHTLAYEGSTKLWSLLGSDKNVRALGALTGNQAVQQAQAGLLSAYVSGWQVAADANLSLEMYPDQSLYASNSVPAVVRKINNALLRADQVAYLDGDTSIDYLVPLVADAEAGFGGHLNAFELMKQMIEAGASGVHYEDQLSSAKKCGHLAGKVLVPTKEFVRKLIAARLAADVCGVPIVLIARTDADSAKLLTNNIDPIDCRFIVPGKDRTDEGFFWINGGLDCAISRGLAYAPYADLVWCETSTPDLKQARIFAEAIHEQYPSKYLAYNCSPSFNWKAKLNDATIAKFQRELSAMGYKYQFVTLAGFHALNLSMFNLALDYKNRGMSAYSEMQENEFDCEKDGYSATKHQKFVGTGYFDSVMNIISENQSSVNALEGSTESQQF